MIALRRHFLFASAVCGVLSAGVLPTAAADCAVYRNNIDFQREMVVRMMADSGEDCRVYFPLAEQTVIDVNQITIHPFYGGARVHGTSGAYYRSNPGYRGPDRFSFKFCGRDAGKLACARVQVKVDVR